MINGNSMRSTEAGGRVFYDKGNIAEYLDKGV